MSLITYNNKTKTITEWAKELKIHTCTLINRLKSGWDTNRAFNEKVSEDRYHREMREVCDD